MTAYDNTPYKYPRDRSKQNKTTQKKPSEKSRKPSNRTTTIHLRLARFLVSLRDSVRSARAALRASNTHCAADIIIGEPGGTASRPADNKRASFTTLQTDAKSHHEQKYTTRRGHKERNENDNSMYHFPSHCTQLRPHPNSNSSVLSPATLGRHTG